MLFFFFIPSKQKLIKFKANFFKGKTSLTIDFHLEVKISEYIKKNILGGVGGRCQPTRVTAIDIISFSSVCFAKRAEKFNSLGGGGWGESAEFILSH